jgi:hypothetical protein
MLLAARRSRTAEAAAAMSESLGGSIPESLGRGDVGGDGDARSSMPSIYRPRRRSCRCAATCIHSWWCHVRCAVAVSAVYPQYISCA